MIYTPFCRSCDADSEYTKHNEIRLKNKRDSFAKLGYAEKFQFKFVKFFSSNTSCIVKKNLKMSILEVYSDSVRYDSLNL